MMRGGNDDVVATAVRDTMLRQLLDDPAAGKVEFANPPDAAKTGDAAMKAALAEKLRKLPDALAAIGQAADRGASRQAVASFEAKRLMGLQAERIEAQCRLREWDPSGRIDLDKPRGKKTCEQIVRAIELREKLWPGGRQAHAPAPAEHEEAFKEYQAVCRALRRFDPQRLDLSLRRSFDFDAYLTELEGRPRAPGQPSALEKLKQAAEAVGTLRGKSGQRQHVALQMSAVGTQVALLQTELNARRKAMGEELHATLRDAIRAAVLVERGLVPEAEGKVGKFRPMDHQEKIRARLVSWGVPEAAWPEIDDVLCREFGPDEIATWPKQSVVTDTYAKKAATLRTDKENKAAHPVGAPPPPKEIDVRALVALPEAIDRLQSGTRVKVNVVYGGEGNTGWIGIPSVTPEGRVRVMVRSLCQQEQARTAEGHEFALRGGFDVKGGLDIQYRAAGFSAMGAQLHAGVTASADLGKVVFNKGLSLRFKNAADMQALKERYLATGRITAEDLVKYAAEIMPMREERTTGRLGVAGRAGVGYGIEQAAVPGRGGTPLPTSVGAHAAVGVGVQGQVIDVEARNTNMNIKRRIREVFVDANARAAVGVTVAGRGADSTLR